MVLVIKLRFFNVLFLCKIDREKVFCNIVDRKQIFLGYKNFDLMKKVAKMPRGMSTFRSYFRTLFGIGCNNDCLFLV